MSMPALFKGRLSIPVIGAPLFIISVPDLVIAQCKAGVVGSFPSLNARPPALLDEWLARIKEELAAHDKAHPEAPSAPFAVNQIVHKSNNRLDQDLALCEKHKVPMMITSLGAREELNQAAHGWGCIVFHDVINQRFAHKAVEKGADGLILVSAGAGGHAGEISPLAFVAETRQWFDGPIALSGAIANGRAIRAARILGADFAYIGSAFIATAEANAVEGYKQMITASAAEDIVYSNLFTGVHGNYLKPSIVAAGMDPENLPTSDPSKMSFGTDASGERAKPKAWKEIWGSGQGVGSVGKSLAGSRTDRAVQEGICRGDRSAAVISSFSPCGRRWRAAPDEGFLSTERFISAERTPHPSRRRSAPSIHPLPQGEREESEPSHVQIHPHRLRLGKILDRGRAVFPAETGIAHAAPRQPHIGIAIGVDPDRAGFCLPGETLDAADVAAPYPGGEAVGGAVGDPQRIGLIA